MVLSIRLVVELRESINFRQHLEFYWKAKLLETS